jgi:hypothetical protein
MTPTLEELKRRVDDFSTMSLPGQPQMMHMGTSYLVNDLYNRVAELQQENEYLIDKLYPLLDALRDLPELPPPRVLLTLSHAADFSKDWDTGKRIQREKGLCAVPPKTECEEGAGWWHRVIRRES